MHSLSPLWRGERVSGTIDEEMELAVFKNSKKNRHQASNPRSETSNKRDTKGKG